MRITIILFFCLSILLFFSTTLAQGEPYTVFAFIAPCADGEIPDELAFIDNLQSEMNLMYSQSSTNTSVLFCGVKRLSTPLTTSNYCTEINPGRPWRAIAEPLRDTYAADIVYLFMTDFGGLGGGRGGGCANMYASAANAYAAGDMNVGFITAHEIGHIFGAGHQRIDYNIDSIGCVNSDPGNWPAAYRHGFYDTTTGSCCEWRTLMDQCGGKAMETGVEAPQIELLSNPGVTYGGDPIGTANFEDVARLHDERLIGTLDPGGRGAVRDFRVTPAIMNLSADTIGTGELRRAIATTTINISGPFKVDKNARFTASIGAPNISLPKRQGADHAYFDQIDLDGGASQQRQSGIRRFAILPQGNAEISFYSAQPIEGKVEVFDAAGRLVAQRELRGINAGLNLLTFEINAIEKGFYIARLRLGSKAYSKVVMAAIHR